MPQLIDFWREFLSTYRSNTLTNYIFPVASGVWLAFVTANLIMLRASEAKAVAGLRRIREQFMMIQRHSFRTFSAVEIPFLGNPVLEAADELAAHGYNTTADEYRAALLSRIQNPIAHDMMMTAVRLGALGTGFPEGHFPSKAETAEMNLFWSRSYATIFTEVNPAIDRIRNCPKEWFTILELTTAAGIWRRIQRASTRVILKFEKVRDRLRSEPCRCPKCGHKEPTI